MARINAYPFITTIADSDAWIGTKASDGATKQFTAADVAAYVNSTSLGYTSYVALISQTGTNAPIATQLANTTNKTFTFTRVSGGSYRITASGSLFTSGKTIVFLNGGAAENNHDVAWLRVSNTIINLETHNSDGKFTNGSLEIRIYN